MSLRTFSVEGERSRRTEVTVEERQRTVVFMRGGGPGDDVCPLCGQSVDVGGCVEALHPVTSLDQARMPAPGTGAVIAGEIVGQGEIAGRANDPQSLGSAKLRVVPRRLR